MKQLKAQNSDKLTTTNDELIGRGKRKRKSSHLRTLHCDEISITSNESSGSDITFPKIPESCLPLDVDFHEKQVCAQVATGKIGYAV